MWLQTRPCRSRCGVQVKWTPNTVSVTVFIGCLRDVRETLIRFPRRFQISLSTKTGGVPKLTGLGSAPWDVRETLIRFSSMIPDFSFHKNRGCPQANWSWICPMIPVQLDVPDTAPTEKHPHHLIYVSIKRSSGSTLRFSQIVKLLTLSWRVSLPALWTNCFSVTLFFCPLPTARRNRWRTAT